MLIYAVDTPFYFDCFNIEDPNDPAIGLVNGAENFRRVDENQGAS